MSSGNFVTSTHPAADGDGRVVVVPTKHYDERQNRRLRERIGAGDVDCVALEFDDRTYERAVAGDERSRVEAAREYAGRLRGHPPGAAALRVGHGLVGAVSRAVQAVVGDGREAADATVAAEAAADRGLPVALVDRPRRDLYAGLAEALSVRDLAAIPFRLYRLRSALRETLDDPGNASIETRADAEAVLAVQAEHFPAVTRVAIEQRNAHMAERLHALRRAGKRVVFPVGFVHWPGVARTLDDLAGTAAPAAGSVPVRRPGASAGEP